MNYTPGDDPEEEQRIAAILEAIMGPESPYTRNSNGSFETVNYRLGKIESTALTLDKKVDKLDDLNNRMINLEHYVKALDKKTTALNTLTKEVATVKGSMYYIAIVITAILVLVGYLLAMHFKP